MADANSGNFILASMYETPQALSPCLRLLIEILLNEANTKHSEVSAVNTINWGNAEGRKPDPERSLEASSRGAARM